MWWGPLTNQKPPRAIDQSQLVWRGQGGAHRGGAEGCGGERMGCEGGVEGVLGGAEGVQRVTEGHRGGTEGV